MAEHTHIEWADATFNPWIGCQKVGPPCDFCYAETYGHRFGVEWGPHADRRRTSEGYWRQLRRWSAKAEAENKRPFVFGGSLCDVFDNAVDPGWRREYFAEVRASPALVLLFLTKRPQNIERMCEEAGGLPSNAALGATMASGPEVLRDAGHLVQAGHHLRPLFLFASVEPMLGPVARELRPWLPAIRWVIGGGESGPHARPVEAQWAYDLRDVCAEKGAHFLWKQWGEHSEGGVRLGKKNAGRALQGVVHNERPQAPPL